MSLEHLLLSWYPYQEPTNSEYHHKSTLTREPGPEFGPGCPLRSKFTLQRLTVCAVPPLPAITAAGAGIGRALLRPSRPGQRTLTRKLEPESGPGCPIRSNFAHQRSMYHSLRRGGCIPINVAHIKPLSVVAVNQAFLNGSRLTLCAVPPLAAIAIPRAGVRRSLLRRPSPSRPARF